MTGTTTTRRAARRSRGGATVFGVIGELLLTAGVVVLLYVAWQLWVGDAIQGAQNNAEGSDLAQQWQSEISPDPDPQAAPPIEPVIASEPSDGERFGVVHIPRFGDDYAVPVAGGVSRAGTLDSIGIGHYPGTAMPGGVGNVGLAAHRTTFGAPFRGIADLRIGDPIVIETEDGWYTYRFRTLEYVQPTAVDVLEAVPQLSSTPDGERYLTLTSCSPMYSLAERIIAYAVFDAFHPRGDGPPGPVDRRA